MSKKIVVNGITFECSNTNFDPLFPVCSLATDDVLSVQTAFRDYNSIEVYDEETLVGTYTGWNTYETIKIVPNTTSVMFPDLDFYVMVQLGKEDIRSVVKQLDAQINPKYDTDSMSLDEIKEMKIAESKKVLAEWLETHPLTSSAHGGKEGTYSVTEAKQSLLTSQYTSYMLEKQVNPNAVITWNETGQECEVWTDTEIVQLICEIKAYVYPRVAKQQKYECDIQAMALKADVLAVTFDYDDVAGHEVNVGGGDEVTEGTDVTEGTE